MNSLLGWTPPSATIPISQVGKLGNCEDVAMTALHRTVRLLPLLTSRRHIDFGRTSSAICRPLRELRGTCRHRTENR